MNDIVELPHLITHIYWDSKESFQLNEDTYEYGVIFAVEQGSFRYRIGAHQGIAEFGEIVICPPHTAFQRETISPLSFHFLLFDFQSSKDGSVYDNIPSGKIPLGNKERLQDNYVQLRQKDRIHPTLPSPYKQHVFLDLWFMILQKQKTILPAKFISHQDSFMLEAASIIERDAFGHIQLKQLASQFGLSPIQFTRRFHKAFKVNPIDYLTSIRLQRATILLTDTDWKLDHIAVHCGYESGFYLSRLFSKHMSMSPSDFRRKHRL